MKPKSLERQIAELSTLSIPTLRRRYRLLYGFPPPQHTSRTLLHQAVGYCLQMQRNARLNSKAMQALAAAEAILSILSSNSSETELVREWKGRVHSVTVLEHGVIYQGEHFSSLSVVARKITGRRQSGTAFFGLKPAIQSNADEPA